MIARTPPTTQILELFSMEDGWFDGFGTAPNRDVLKWLYGHYVLDFGAKRIPYIYPEPEGGVFIEFGEFVSGISIEIKEGFKCEVSFLFFGPNEIHFYFTCCAIEKFKMLETAVELIISGNFWGSDIQKEIEKSSRNHKG